MSQISRCVYVGMDAKTTPLCLVDNLINNSSDKDVCNIADKEIVTKWSDYDTIAVILPNAYKRNLRRYCQISRGGRNDSCEFGARDAKLKEHLQFVPEKRTWNDAKSHCIEIGGSLFYDLKFTETRSDIEDRLRLTIRKMKEFYGQFTNFWLGIHRSPVSTNQFLDIDNKTINIPDFVWAAGQPDGQDCLLVYGNYSQMANYTQVNGYQYLHDDSCELELCSICQIKE